MNRVLSIDVALLLETGKAGIVYSLHRSGSLPSIAKGVVTREQFRDSSPSEVLC